MAKKSKMFKTFLWNKRISSQSLSRKTLKDAVIDGDINASIKLSRFHSYSLSRRKNRCMITGNPRSYYRHVSMNRNLFLHLARFNFLPGFQKF